VLFLKKHNSDDLAHVILLRFNPLGKMLQAIGPIASDLPQNIHKYSEEPNLLPKHHRNAIFMTELTTAFIITPIFCFVSIFTTTQDGRNIHKRGIPLSQIKL
jgi:hypothetical protein